jgi:cyanophycin synthetase
MTDDTGEPRFAFDESRRLTGPNRWYGGTAVILTALGDASDYEGWCARVRSVCDTLGWPDPAPGVHRHAHGALLAFAAPEHALFTATEVNEWAWEQGCTGFDRAHAYADPEAVFTARAAAERSRPLQRLQDAAASRNVPYFCDDDTLTLGAGYASASWPRAALPLPMDVPWPRLHDIPKALVTGSNGKTTTVRLLAAMARAAGHSAGLASTEGVAIGDEFVARGDYSGPAGARIVLRDPRVTLALLETARGGIARRGLAVTQADAAIVTNVSADHFGEYGIDSEADLAELKLVVARTVAERGVLVLNAGDAVLMATADRLPHAARARRALFAPDADHPALVALRAAGGATCGARNGHLVLELGPSASHDLGAVDVLPLTLQGSALYNLMNIAAAALTATAGLHLPVDAVRATAQRFGQRHDDNPGRLERHRWRGATVLIDYAHNPDGLGRLLAVANAQPHRNRLLLFLGQAGNRSDSAIAELARTAAASSPDLVIVKELSAMLRGRAPGEVPALLAQALRGAGLAARQIENRGEDESVAAPALLARSQPGDVVVLPVHSNEGRRALHAMLAGDDSDGERRR